LQLRFNKKIKNKWTSLFQKSTKTQNSGLIALTSPPKRNLVDIFKVKNYTNSMIGSNIQQLEGFSAFIPHSFPPENGFQFSDALYAKLNETTRLVGKLDGATLLLPDMDFFTVMYIRKDATSSSQIEGTRATMIDAIEYESQTQSDGDTDVDDIIHYIDAVNYGIDRLKEFPFALRFIKELHGVLMKDGRASHYADPGEFRKSQNWIGGISPSQADFVPPPVYDMEKALSDLEKFINKESVVSPILKAGLMHAQFETIHPFLDGNGRTGRLLITLYLLKAGILERPTLYLSTFFKKHQQLYYNKLQDYHHGNVEKWLDFYLDGVSQVAKDAIGTVQKITELRFTDILKIQSLNKKSSESTILVLPKLFSLPIIKVSTIQEWTGFSKTGAKAVIDRLVELEILHVKDETETYARSYVYKKYIEIFND
jgi:Fic family protein